MTSSPEPDASGSYPTRRRGPDSTDPDLVPVAVDGSGPAPAYGEPAYAEVAPVDDTLSVDDEAVDDEAVDDGVDEEADHEAVEDGLRGSREPGAVAVAARLSRRPRDMVISIGVLLVVVFAFFGLYRCLGDDDGARVDPGPAIAEARKAGAFPVAEPSGLGSDWKPVSAVYQPQAAGAVLRIGWRTPDDGTLQLIEGDVSPDVLVARELGEEARATRSVEINGKSWQAYEARKGERALVLEEAGRTIIVIGRASEAELQQFAAALK